jgi:hypothetical protein
MRGIVEMRRHGAASDKDSQWPRARVWCSSTCMHVASERDKAAGGKHAGSSCVSAWSSAGRQAPTHQPTNPPHAHAARQCAKTVARSVHRVVAGTPQPGLLWFASRSVVAVPSPYDTCSSRDARSSQYARSAAVSQKGRAATRQRRRRAATPAKRLCAVDAIKERPWATGLVMVMGMMTTLQDETRNAARVAYTAALATAAMDQDSA